MPARPALTILVRLLSACCLLVLTTASDTRAEDAANAATAAEPEPAATPAGEAPSGPRNLLNPEDCEIIAAPSDRAAKLLEGAFDMPADELAEAIYSFRDGKGATIQGVRIFINRKDDQAIKSVEILGADSASGPFKPVAKAGDTVNLKLFKSKGWQDFSFAPVTVRYFRVKAVAHNHEWVRVENDLQSNGLQLIGEPLP